MTDERMTKAMAALEEQRQQHGLNLSGRLYSKVADRVEIFRVHFGTDYSIETHMDYAAGFNKGAAIVARCNIGEIKSGQVVASGHAVEFVGTDDFTFYSPIEVAETSAIGRALAAFGLSGGEYASANEIEAKEAARGGDRASRPEETRRVSNGAEGDTYKSDAPEEYEVSETTGLYIPSEHDAIWDKPGDLQDVILDGIEKIRDTDTLSLYWAELKPAMGRLNDKEPRIFGQIKAAFAAAYSAIEGRA